jgi:hypothetical protein
MTVLISQKWLPKLQKVYKVMPIHQCLNDPHPYWEENWVYPTLDNPNPPTFAVPKSGSVKDEKISSAAFILTTPSHIIAALLGVFLCVLSL